MYQGLGVDFFWLEGRGGGGGGGGGGGLSLILYRLTHMTTYKCSEESQCYSRRLLFR